MRQVHLKGMQQLKEFGLDGAESILTTEALEFVTDLHGRFNKKRLELIDARKIVQQNIKAGILPDFLPETKEIRRSNWKIWPIPQQLLDRRVEITGPASSPKLVIKAHNSGANVFMADAEDSESPTWKNIVSGQINLYEAIRKKLTYSDKEKNKTYALNARTAILFFRPRGWHLEEAHLTLSGESVSASLFDFGLYLFHNALELRKHGNAPYFYLPKMESYLEARLWNEVFVYASDRLGLLPGEIKATALIETLPAAFQMAEILYELRAHSAGLNCGRWDYIFSYIKRLRHYDRFVLPDRGQLTMDKGFLASYVKLLIHTCHKHGAHAMGGMAAQLPIKGTDDESVKANREAELKFKADKAREVKAGHDGTWVAHPAFVPMAKEIFDLVMKGNNQIDTVRSDEYPSAEDLLRPIEGVITEEGVRKNLDVGIRYLWHWLRGTGAVAINNLMEDAATAEISRAQLWQWLKHGAMMIDGRKVTLELINELLSEIQSKAFTDPDLDDSYEDAVELFMSMITGEEFEEFLTIPGYAELLCKESEWTP